MKSEPCESVPLEAGGGGRITSSLLRFISKLHPDYTLLGLAVISHTCQRCVCHVCVTFMWFRGAFIIDNVNCIQAISCFLNKDQNRLFSESVRQETQFNVVLIFHCTAASKSKLTVLHIVKKTFCLPLPMLVRIFCARFAENSK